MAKEGNALCVNGLRKFASTRKHFTKLWPQAGQYGRQAEFQVLEGQRKTQIPKVRVVFQQPELSSISAKISREVVSWNIYRIPSAVGSCNTQDKEQLELHRLAMTVR